METAEEIPNPYRTKSIEQYEEKTKCKEKFRIIKMRDYDHHHDDDQYPIYKYVIQIKKFFKFQDLKEFNNIKIANKEFDFYIEECSKPRDILYNIGNARVIEDKLSIYFQIKYFGFYWYNAEIHKKTHEHPVDINALTKKCNDYLKFGTFDDNIIRQNFIANNNLLIFNTIYRMIVKYWWIVVIAAFNIIFFTYKKHSVRTSAQIDCAQYGEKANVFTELNSDNECYIFKNNKWMNKNELFHVPGGIDDYKYPFTEYKYPLTSTNNFYKYYDLEGKNE